MSCYFFQQKIKDCLDSNLKKMRKKSLSCVNIRRKFDAKNLTSSTSKKLSGDDHPTGIFVCTKRIDDDEGIIPLLQKAGSLSSFNSFTPATEESFLESSTDDGPTKSDYERRRQQKAIRRATTGKIRCLKHRPHSMSLSERNLARLQQENSSSSNNILKEKNDNDIDEDVDDNKEHNLSVPPSMCSKENLPCDGVGDLNNANLTPPSTSRQHCCAVGMTRKQRRSLRTTNNNSFNKSTTPTSPLPSPTGNDSDDNNNNNTSIGSDTEAQISFSKEQRKKLKQRMRERQRFQDKSVFLGLF